MISFISQIRLPVRLGVFSLVFFYLTSHMQCYALDKLAVLDSKMQPTPGMQAKPSKKTAGQKSFSGNISWYGRQFHGRKTASGEIFDMNKLTAAHLTLPFGTRVLVEDPRTGNTVIVKVNDRGPYVKMRIMDLAREGARELGTMGRGVAYVDCLVLIN